MSPRLFHYAADVFASPCRQMPLSPPLMIDADDAYIYPLTHAASSFSLFSFIAALISLRR